MTNKKVALIKKRVVLVDDHPMVRQGMAKLINDDPHLAVIGEAGSGKDALTLIAREKPDLVVADLSLPDYDGLSLLKNLTVLYPALPVLFLSMHEEATYAERVLRAGGRGYIMKAEPGELIMEAIHRVLAGEIYLSPAMAQSILSRLNAAPRTQSVCSMSLLSDRELEVYKLVGQGFKCSEIAKKMHLSPKTIETHFLHIRTKLNLNGARELRQSAIEWSHGEKSFC